MSIRISVYLFAVIFFLSFTCRIFATSSNDSFYELHSGERQKIMEKMKSLQKNIHAISASVIQEKKLSALKKKVTIEGTVTMSKPNMIRWDITKPEKSLTVIDGETMTVYHPEVKEAQIYNISENFIASNTMSFFATAMGGDLSEMEKKFIVNVFQKDEEIIFKLVPLSKIAGRYLSSIMIYYDERSGLPKGFDVTTPKGDRTIIRLSNIKINPELKSDAFTIRLPSDVWITNKSEEHINN